MVTMKTGWIFILLAIASLHAEEVVPRRRYRAEFDAKATVRIPPRDWRMIGIPASYPEAELLFFDTAGKRVRTLPHGSRFAVESSEFSPGAIESYAPDDAARAELKGRGALLRNVRITQVSASKLRSILPDFRVSGIWRGAQITPFADGTAIFDLSYGFMAGDPIPVTSGEKLRLSVGGGNGDRNSGVVIRTEFFRDSRGEKSFLRRNAEPLRLRGTAKNFVYDFSVPPGAQWMRITLMWGYVQHYKIEEQP